MFQEIENSKEISALGEGLYVGDIKSSLLPQVALPEAVGDMIPTLNKKGYMKILRDEFSEEFVEFASKSKKPVLEIGCAYGYTAKEVLNRGGQIIANDVSRDHLLYLAKNVSKEQSKNLYLYRGYFPEDFAVPDGVVSAVLSSRMMHFLKGFEVEAGLQKINRMLAKDGKFFFVALSPYFKPLSDNDFHLEYNKRMSNGENWPGEIQNHLEMAHMHSKFVSEFLHVFDDKMLQELLPKFGFEIERIKLFEYPGDAESGNRGHVGFVARKVCSI